MPKKMLLLFYTIFRVALVILIVYICETIKF
jgi:hypothetical protein